MKTVISTKGQLVLPGRASPARRRRPRPGVRNRAARTGSLPSRAHRGTDERRFGGLVAGLPREGVVRARSLRIDRRPCRIRGSGSRPIRYLVDANVLSEATRPCPDPSVIEWLRNHEPRLVVNPVVLGEVWYGIRLLRPGRGRDSLEFWFNEVVRRIHCVPVDANTGLRWAELLAGLRSRGRSMPVKDSSDRGYCP